MINRKKIIFVFVLLLIINFKSFSNENIFIIYKVNNEIITNMDVKKELAYLQVLSNQLQNLEKKTALKIARESILREKIKKIELSKYIDLNEKDEVIINDYIKNFYIKLKLNNKDEFLVLLKNNGLSIDYVEKKVQIEISWNRMIYEKFKDQLNIDLNELKRQIKSVTNDTNEKIYSLSEIVFDQKNKDNFSENVKKINDSIKEIGFENTANIYSISDSAKFGGEIGDIGEKVLSKKFLSELQTLKVDQHTQPIQVGNAFLILKIDNIRYEDKKIDVDQKLNKKIEFEQGRQLNQFSKNHFNRIKINTSIDEL